MPRQVAGLKLSVSPSPVAPPAFAKPYAWDLRCPHEALSAAGSAAADCPLLRELSDLEC